jgi:hypothetical protein
MPEETLGAAALAFAELEQLAPPPDPARAEADEAREIAQSRLFDAPFYLARHADVAEDGVDPLLHFCRFGWRENRDPNAWFDCAFYLETYADVRSSGLNPLLHYIRHGEREGRPPHRLFEPGWYRTAYALDPAQSPLRHFLDHRTEFRSAPSPALQSLLFDPALARLAACRVDAFRHYLDQFGGSDAPPAPDHAIVRDSDLLDLNYYLINGADVHRADLDPVAHFCAYGWRELRNPNIYFNTRWYIATNEDVRRTEINPLVHYIVTGETKGRRPVVYFDPTWYRAAYGLNADESPLAHYLRHRRSQRFSPIEAFDVAYYLERYRDLVGPNRDPFAHFLQTGTFRDLDPSKDFDSAAYRRAHLGRPSRHFRERMHPERDNPLVHALHAAYR